MSYSRFVSLQSLKVDDSAVGERADKFLANHFPQVSRTRLQKLFDNEQVMLDGEPIVKSHGLLAGDLLEFPHPDTLSRPIEPRKINFDVLYEDKSLLIINKPAGIAVHPVSQDDDQTTLAHGVLAYLGETARKIGPEGRHCIVHRLDKDTTGVLIIAKTPKAFEGMKDIFANRKIEKEYLAIVRGCVELLAGTVDAPIGRSPRNPLKMVIRDDGGRESRTDWERVKNDPAGGLALLKCYLHTGRTHQARVHLAHLGYPVVGDVAYGYRGTYQGRPLLHAHCVKFTHPISDKPLEISAPIPADMKAFKALFK